MITIIGMGFVGRANAELLSRHNEIKVYDTNPDVLNKCNYSSDNIYDSDFFVVCVPTDGNNGRLDCSVVDNCISDILSHRPDAKIIIRSTVSIGFTILMRKKHGTDRIYFVPEFLREKMWLYDTLNPSRIIASNNKIAELFKKSTCGDPPVLICSDTEAEAIKLFSNSFLAARIALFNEVDTECLKLGLDTKNVITGMCLDERIGRNYNNPSFGFGGYCLPKDSEEVANCVEGVLFRMIPESNRRRIKFIADLINSKFKGRTVGILSSELNARKSPVAEMINKMTVNTEIIDIPETVICNRPINTYSRDIFGGD